jgi:shikimate 5-dehydrogenase/shikimate kinase
MSAVDSVVAQSDSSPTPSPADSLSFRRQYAPDATLLLVGFFAAGKKTLGIIASVSLRRRFIDFDAFFRQEVHSSPQDFISRHGLERYREVELKLSRDLLTKFSKGCVIVGLGASSSGPQQSLLVEFAKEHPVIYVRRDASDLQQLLRSTQDKFQRIFKIGNEFFELCSNFDFFNHTQGQPSWDSRQLPNYLKLKETERAFVAFLHRIFGNTHRSVSSVDPFSPSHTFALQVPLTWLDGTEDLESLEGGADAISLVVLPEEFNSRTFIERLARHMENLRRHCRVPVIVDVTTSPVMWADRETYHRTLMSVLRLAPDAITCSLQYGMEVAQKVHNSKGNTILIASVHEKFPVGSSQRFLHSSALREKLEHSNADALRITGECSLPDDNLATVSFHADLSKSNMPIVCYNLGSFGMASIWLNPTLSPVVLPSMKHTGVTLRQAQEAMTACFLHTKKRFTIFGRTLKHSLSPEMHNAAYAVCGLPHIYGSLQSEDFSSVHRLMEDENHGGVAISLPYKSAILPFLDEVSPDAKDINAVNTIVLEHKYQANGKRVTIRRGYNTDYVGIKECIEKHLSPANTIRDGTTALVIGAGGMAHAAIYACKELGVQSMCIYNRTPDNAQKLADYYHQWAQSKPEVKLHLHILQSPGDSWPTDLRPPTIVVSCIPGYQIGGEKLIAMQLPDAWFKSRTGGVFVEVRRALPQNRILLKFTAGRLWAIQNPTDGADDPSRIEGVGCGRWANGSGRAGHRPIRALYGATRACSFHAASYQGAVYEVWIYSWMKGNISFPGSAMAACN